MLHLVLVPQQMAEQHILPSREWQKLIPGAGQKEEKGVCDYQ